MPDFQNQHFSTVFPDLVDDPVVSDPNAPFIFFAPTELTATWRAGLLREVVNCGIYAVSDFRWQTGYLLLRLARNSYRVGHLSSRLLYLPGFPAWLDPRG